MNQTVIIVLNAIQLIFFIPLALATLYIFVYAVAGLFYRQPPYPVKPMLLKIAVLIPGYKEDEVIVEVAKEGLLQDYPQDYYDIIIIADSFQPETITSLKTLPIQVIEVKFDKSTKSKALNKAMERLPSGYEIAVILDADNLMAPRPRPPAQKRNRSAGLELELHKSRL